MIRSIGSFTTSTEYDFVEGGMVLMVVRGLRVIRVGRNRMRSEAQRSTFAIKETLLIQSAEPIERSEAPCASCLSAPLHVHSRYADPGSTSSVALIHFHYVAWHYRNARPGLALSSPMLLAPLSTVMPKQKLLSGFRLCCCELQRCDLH